MEFLPKEQCQKVLFLYIMLLHDINDIIVLSYEFHIMFNYLIMHMSFVVCLLFHEGKQKFLQTVLNQEDEEETVTLLRETDTQPSRGDKTDNTLIVWISSSQHDNS